MDKNKIAVDLFNKLATSYQNKFMDVSMYGDTFDFFCNAVKKKDAELLELACGPGNITNYLLKQRPDFKITGTDLAPNMISLAMINNPQAEFQVMDCRNIGTISKKYDAIMCGFCLPYLAKEETEKLIADTSKLLRSNGVIYLSTIEDDHSKSTFKKGSTGEEIFMHYYTGDHLTNVFEKNQFKILKIERKKYAAQDGTKTTDVIIIAEK